MSKKEMDLFYMRQAVREAEKAFAADEVPIGAVLVRKNAVVGRAHNQVRMLRDPTAHGEMIAITQACEALQSEHLPETTLYVTLEPCPMCVGAMILARIERLVFGAREKKTGACGSKVHLLADAHWNHRFRIEEGLLEFESAALLKEFFRKKRPRGADLPEVE
ncbi:MAG TPA: tRNA adenosine(34) deaminase TadA [Candidatus Eisenbacteria bacterium]|jgi:tRNA(adenine34) deaminase|nr:tRNA adenosine(34) deaminase TadA [Candidatus Eisenbacteria bacterium]